VTRLLAVTISQAVRLKVDLINMSYGEAVAVNTTGRIMKMIEEVGSHDNCT
jgi:hypothetical protein